jgi:serine/threonine protein kinase
MVIVQGTTVYGASKAEYEVREYLGSGSFGTVYKAVSRSNGHTYALKSLSTPFSDPADLMTFVNEGKLAMGIKHPNVVEYLYFHDGSTYEGLPPYILMEYAAGGTLGDLIEAAQREGKHFSPDDLVTMFRQLIAGMAAINSTLIHRDIKPDNILIDGERLKITDFGLAKVVFEATRSFTFKGGGTYPYIAPEGWRQEKNTPMLDIYAMGVVFYELATLQRPIEVSGADPHKWMDAHLYQPVTSANKLNPSLGPKLSQIIMKMVEKSTSRRFNNWETIAEILDRDEPGTPAERAILGAMLQRRLHQDTEKQAAEATAQLKAKQRADFCMLTLSQAYQAIIQPLESLIEEFNQRYVGEKAMIVTVPPEGEGTSCALYLPSGKRINLSFRTFLAEEFQREIPITNYGNVVYQERILIPELNKKKIQCWGILKASDGRGFNFALCEKPGEIYGEWFMLIPKMGLPSRSKSRPEPFPFEEDEFEDELRMLGATHIYSTKVTPLDLEYLQQFIIEYV